MVTSTKLKWKTDLDKQVIIQNFEKRGWQKAQGEGKYIIQSIKSKIDDWNIFWANVWTVKQIFNPETGHRLGEMQ